MTVAHLIRTFVVLNIFYENSKIIERFVKVIIIFNFIFIRRLLYVVKFYEETTADERKAKD